MISKEIPAQTLEEYYTKLCALQAGAHKETYLLVHDEIRRCVKNSSSYTELGINQGATLAAALLLDIPKVRAYDITLGWYNKAKMLFDEYASTHSVDYQVFEADSHSITIEDTDVLYIDTLHKYEHLVKELQLHGHKVQRYIIFHDTHAAKGLKKAVTEYVAKNPVWNIVTDCTENVGFMTIAK